MFAFLFLVFHFLLRSFVACMSSFHLFSWLDPDEMVSCISVSQIVATYLSSGRIKRQHGRWLAVLGVLG